MVYVKKDYKLIAENLIDRFDLVVLQNKSDLILV
jgi:hypothetical protein